MSTRQSTTATRESQVSSDGRSQGGQGGQGHLITEAGEHLRTLLRAEMALGMRELAGSARSAAMAAAVLSGAAVFALYGGGALVTTIILGLEGAPPILWEAPLVVGAVLVILGGAMAAVGMLRLRGLGPPLSAATLDRLKQDLDAVRTEIAPGHTSSADRPMQREQSR
jgi:hypothetical protein